MKIWVVSIRKKEISKFTFQGLKWELSRARALCTRISYKDIVFYDTALLASIAGFPCLPQPAFSPCLWMDQDLWLPWLLVTPSPYCVQVSAEGFTYSEWTAAEGWNCEKWQHSEAKRHWPDNIKLWPPPLSAWLCFSMLPCGEGDVGLVFFA